MSDHIHFEELWYIASGDITNAFQPINVDGFTLPCGIIKITNNSDISVIISYDGVNEHDYIRKATSVEIRFPTCLFNGELKKYTIVYVKLSPFGAKLPIGSIYISGIIDK